MPKKQGKLIVIDGADGAGKATQTALLLARLKKEKYRVRTLDFPQYENNLLGALIGECLAGKHGDFLKLDPKIASLLYAADRFESKKKIDQWLKAGYAVVLDRYVSANQIHQGGKIENARERADFLRWLDALEYGVFGLPRPEVIVYLDVPSNISQKLLEKKSVAQKKKTYLKKGEKDVVESDTVYGEMSRLSALKMVQKNNQWERVVCVEKGVLLEREDIHERIWTTIQKYI